MKSFRGSLFKASAIRSSSNTSTAAQLLRRHDAGAAYGDGDPVAAETPTVK
jgi:hypothetical protein